MSDLGEWNRSEMSSPLRGFKDGTGSKFIIGMSIKLPAQQLRVEAAMTLITLHSI
jgi:hypothetical protein